MGKIAVSLLVAAVCLNLAGIDGFLFNLLGNGPQRHRVGIGAHVGAGNGGGIGAGLDLGPLGHIGVNLGGRNGLGIGGHFGLGHGIGIGGRVGLGEGGLGVGGGLGLGGLGHAAAGGHIGGGGIGIGGHAQIGAGGHRVEEGRRCGPVCLIYCPNGNVRDANGCPICKCNPIAVPERKCGPLMCRSRVGCLYGHAKDANGCSTCDCNPRPGKVEVNTLETSETSSGGFHIGGKFDINMFRGKCPVGTEQVGNMCKITSTDLFLPWLKANAASYGIHYTYTPIKVEESEDEGEDHEDEDEE